LQVNDLPVEFPLGLLSDPLDDIGDVARPLIPVARLWILLRLGWGFRLLRLRIGLRRGLGGLPGASSWGRSVGEIVIPLAAWRLTRVSAPVAYQSTVPKYL
jgi:hypothetical protein